MTEEFMNRIASNTDTNNLIYAMSLLKDMYDGAIAVGFTKQEALALVSAVLTSGANGGKK